MPLIYEPRGKAREYSPLALNLYDGCDHGCTYCFTERIPYTKGFTSKEVKPRKGFSFDKLYREVSKHRFEEQVLLCFHGDPYCHAEMSCGLTRSVLGLFEAFRVPTAILTKGGTRCLRDIDLFHQMRYIKVGATLVVDSKYASTWEPNAAPTLERIEALKRLRDMGVRTWVSFEPVIYPVDTINLLWKCLPYVDEFKIGKINYDPQREKEVDWAKFTEEVVDILRDKEKPFYIKKSLQEKVPDFDFRPEEIDQNYLPGLWERPKRRI